METSAAVLSIVNRRMTNISHLKRIHCGGAYWMNCVLLSKEDILSSYDANLIQKRSLEWLSMGASLASLLTLEGEPYLSALEQFWHEYQFQFSLPNPTWEKKLHEFQNHEWFGKPVSEERLLTSIFSASQMSLDYFQIFYTLCDMLVLMYKRFKNIPDLHENPSLCRTIIRVDASIRSNVLEVLTREMNILSIAIMKKRLASVDALFERLDFEASIITANGGTSG